MHSYLRDNRLLVSNTPAISRSHVEATVRSFFSGLNNYLTYLLKQTRPIQFCEFSLLSHWQYWTFSYPILIRLPLLLSLPFIVVKTKITANAGNEILPTICPVLNISISAARNFSQLFLYFSGPNFNRTNETVFYFAIIQRQLSSHTPGHFRTVLPPQFRLLLREFTPS